MKNNNLHYKPLKVFAKEVVEKMRELDQEKMKTETALHDFLPTSIVRDLKKKKVLWQKSLEGKLKKLKNSV